MALAMDASLVRTGGYGLWTASSFCNDTNNLDVKMMSSDYMDLDSWNDYDTKQINDVKTVVGSYKRVTHPSIVVDKPTEHVIVYYFNIRLMIIHIIVYQIHLIGLFNRYFKKACIYDIHRL
jgi:hypothetical protein